MNDDKLYTPSPYAKYICGLKPWPENCDVIRKTYGYILPEFQKGMGSAYGGRWKPKKEEDERLEGKPNSTNRTHKKDKNGGYDRDTKIGPDGQATKERHYTDHGRPNLHSSPHDHEINWNEDTGNPEFSSPINYPNGAPEFKYFKGAINMCKRYECSNSLEENQFKTVSEFKWCMKQGGEVQFEWKNKDYSITHPHGLIDICESYKEDNSKQYETADEALEYMIDGQRLREIITQVKVWDRTI